MFDYESTTSHEITVEVSDGELQSQAKVIINVTDIVEPFITTWETTVDSQTITIPTNSSYTYNYTVDWGDDSGRESFTGDASHTYATAGTYTIMISGEFPAIYFNNSGSRLLITEVNSWGDIDWKSMRNAFYGCFNVEVFATDAPDLSEVNDMSFMFSDARAFNQPLNGWDVSNVTNMRGIFLKARSFNQDLSSWDVSNVSNMEAMFNGAIVFNQDLSGWDVSKSTSMSFMFNQAAAFNQNLSAWDVSNVTNMLFMFHMATIFDQDLSGWNTSKVLQCRNFSVSSSLSASDLPTLGSCF